MRELLIRAIHLLFTLAKLLRPGGVRAVAAESLLLKHQLLIGNRSRRRAPNLTTLDRFVLGLTTLFVSPRRIPKLGALIRPATLFKFHKALVDRKYRLLFSSVYHCRKPGPKGPSAELIAAIIELKRRNPSFGCVRIAQQISHAFGQVGSGRSGLPSLRRALDRHDSARISRSRILLERGGPEAEAGRVQRLLQRRSGSSRARRLHAGATRGRTLPHSCCA